MARASSAKRGPTSWKFSRTYWLRRKSISFTSAGVRAGGVGFFLSGGAFGASFFTCTAHACGSFSTVVVPQEGHEMRPCVACSWWPSKLGNQPSNLCSRSQIRSYTTILIPFKFLRDVCQPHGSQRVLGNRGRARAAFFCG